MALDGTCMPYRDNSFDVCVDKGTFDALACGPDRSVIRRLTREMIRVSSIATVIISSGTPDRRMNLFNEFVDDKTVLKIEHKKCDISNIAGLINILRSELKNKPLSYALREDPTILKKAMEELARINQEKRMAEAAKTDPRKKLMLLILKAKHKKEREEEAKR